MKQQKRSSLAIATTYLTLIPTSHTHVLTHILSIQCRLENLYSVHDHSPSVKGCETLQELEIRAHLFVKQYYHMHSVLACSRVPSNTMMLPLASEMDNDHIFGYICHSLFRIITYNNNITLCPSHTVLKWHSANTIWTGWRELKLRSLAPATSQCASCLGGNGHLQDGYSHITSFNKQ